jgi:aspartate racemase
MKTIGMVGGTGWISTLEYYRLVNQFTNEKLGGLEAARIILYSVNYGEIDRFNKAGTPEKVYEIVTLAAKAVEKAGADCLMLCANTMHRFAPQLMEEVKIPLIHIGEETAKIIGANNISKVGLLGTKYTMELDFYRSKLDSAGIETIVPEKEEREFINSAITNELLLNRFLMATKLRFNEIISQLIDEGARGIILGCTEIPLLIKQEDVLAPLFNTLEIHARAAVEFALSD